MAKTLEDMRKELKAYCIDRGTCKGCPLSPLPDDFCYEYERVRDGEKLLKEHYKLVFGTVEPVNECEIDFTRKPDDKVRVRLTRRQCESVAEFIEQCLLEVIRNDPDIDNVEWVADMIGAYTKFKRHGEYDD